MDFVALGRQAHRDGEPRIAADSETGREALLTLSRGSQATAARDYYEGWKAAQRETNPVEYLTEEVQATEKHIDSLTREIANTTHTRRLGALHRDLAEAEHNLSRLVTDLGSAVQEA